MHYDCTSHEGIVSQSSMVWLRLGWNADIMHSRHSWWSWATFLAFFYALCYVSEHSMLLERKRERQRECVYVCLCECAFQGREGAQGKEWPWSHRWHGRTAEKDWHPGDRISFMLLKNQFWYRPNKFLKKSVPSVFIGKSTALFQALHCILATVRGMHIQCLPASACNNKKHTT